MIRAWLFLTAIAWSGLLAGQTISEDKVSIEKWPPEVNLVDYTTSQGAHLIFSAPCGGSGPPTWRELCTETMNAFGASLATKAAPVNADLIPIIDTQASNSFKRSSGLQIKNGLNISYKLCSFTTLVDTTNQGATAQTLFTCPIPANTLLAGGRIQVDMAGDWLQNVDADERPTLRVMIDSTEVYQAALIDTTQSATRKPLPIWVNLVGLTSATQYGSVCATIGNTTAATVGLGTMTTAALMSFRCGNLGTGTAGEPSTFDMTAAHDLVMKWTNPTDAATEGFRMRYAIVTITP